MLTVLVTGAAGFLGSVLVKKLENEGINVYGVDIKKSSKLQLDVTQLEQCLCFFRNYHVDAVLHLAAKVGSQPSKKQPYNYFHTNIFGTLNLLEAMHQHNIHNLVYVSSWDVYDFQKVKLPINEDTPTNVESPYGASKICGETLVKTYSDLNPQMHSVILRLCGPLYGPNQQEKTVIQKIVSHMVTGKLFEVYGDGTHQRCFLYVDDAADACIKALEYLMDTHEASSLFTVATQPTTTNQLVKIAQLISPFKVKHVIAPLQIQNRLVNQRGSCKYFTEATGWTPKVTISEGLWQVWQNKRTKSASMLVAAGTIRAT